MTGRLFGTPTLADVSASQPLKLMIVSESDDAMKNELHTVYLAVVKERIQPSRNNTAPASTKNTASGESIESYPLEDVFVGIGRSNNTCKQLKWPAAVSIPDVCFSGTVSGTRFCYFVFLFSYEGFITLCFGVYFYRHGNLF